METSDIMTADERQVLQRICDEVGVPRDIVEEMIAAESRVYGMGRRHGIWEALEALVSRGVGSTKSAGKPGATSDEEEEE